MVILLTLPVENKWKVGVSGMCGRCHACRAETCKESVSDGRAETLYRALAMVVSETGVESVGDGRSDTPKIYRV